MVVKNNLAKILAMAGILAIMGGVSPFASNDKKPDAIVLTKDTNSGTGTPPFGHRDMRPGSADVIKHSYVASAITKWFG